MDLPAQRPLRARPHGRGERQGICSGVQAMIDHPTVLHAFCFLGAHLSHLDDASFQAEERRVLLAAADRLGLAARLDRGQAKQMIHDAVDWYFEVQDDTPVLQSTLRSCVERLTQTFRRNREVLAGLHKELRSIAEAHGGVLPEERRFLGALAQDWQVA